MNGEISILLRRDYKPPTRLGGYVITTNYDPSYEEIINFCLVADWDSLCFKEAFENKRWAQAMIGEMNAVERSKNGSSVLFQVERIQLVSSGFIKQNTNLMENWIDLTEVCLQSVSKQKPSICYFEILPLLQGSTL